MTKYWKQELGKAGEEYVVNLLLKKGWRIKDRNWRAGRYAEIDIIAIDPQNILVFIEVKSRTRTNSEAGFSSAGFDKLDKRKSQKLVSCARLYMAKYLPRYSGKEEGCRFDAFVLYYSATYPTILCNIEPEVQYIKNFLP